MIRVPKILSWSPIREVGYYDYLYIRECPLKGMSKALKFSHPFPEDLPTRPALVGTFHHKVLELTHLASSQSVLEAMVEAEIARLQAKCDSLPHFRKAGSVSGWDEINISVRMAYESFSEIHYDPAGTKYVEKKLSTSDGLLAGRPDFFYVKGESAILKELKSSQIRDVDGGIRTEYSDQVLFYSALLFSNFPISSVDAYIESSRGETFNLSISKADAEHFHLTVQKTIASINERIANAQSVDELCVTSTSNCGTCSKRIVCPVFQRDQIQLNFVSGSYIVSGLLKENDNSPNEGAGRIVIFDEPNQKLHTIMTPTGVTKDLTVGSRYLLTDLYLRNGSYRWTDTTRVMSCD